MSEDNKPNHVCSETLKDLKQDIRELASKLDTMHEVLIKNTVVLEQHEKRSTASEKRLELLENEFISIKNNFSKFKGVYVGIAAVLTALGGFVTFLYYLGIPLFDLFHKVFHK
jgi:hypothetical protein